MNAMCLLWAWTFGFRLRGSRGFLTRAIFSKTVCKKFPLDKPLLLYERIENSGIDNQRFTMTYYFCA